MFIMLFGFPPFHGHDDTITQQKIEAGFDPRVKNGYGAWFPATIPVSDPAKDLIKKLLETDPALRLTASEALEHEWLRDPSANNAEAIPSVLANLANFTASCRFKNAVLSALSSAMDESDAADLKRNFTAMDLNGDGVITVDELKTALSSSIGANPEMAQTIQQLITMGDVDGDGALSYEELVMAFQAKKLAAKEERLYNVFQGLDLNRDGYLSPDEIILSLADFMTEQDQEQIHELIREVDTNGDGHIDYHEFVQIFMTKTSVVPTQP